MLNQSEMDRRVPTGAAAKGFTENNARHVPGKQLASARLSILQIKRNWATRTVADQPAHETRYKLKALVDELDLLYQEQVF